MVPMAPSSSRILSRNGVSSFIGLKKKKPARLAQGGASMRGFDARLFSGICNAPAS
jgi:hypothetical protein